MKRAEIFFVMVVAVFAVVILVHTMPEKSGAAVGQPWTVYIPSAADVQSLVIPGAGVGQAIVPAVQEAPGYVVTAAGDIPNRAALTPQFVEFNVNKIMIPEMQVSAFIPVQRDNPRVFSGKFGPYPEDYSEFIYVELCSFVESQPEMFACEKIRNLNYMDGYLTFARGYDWDEYIAGLAMRNFGTYYEVKSGEFGTLATSNRGIINLVY